MLKRLFKKARRGSLIAVLLFAVVIAIVCFGMLMVASSLYTANEENATHYANVQSYRSAAEMAVYQYATDLQAVVLTKNLDTDWIGVSGPAIYTEGLTLIAETIGQNSAPAGETPNHLKWKVDTIQTAIGAANVSNPAVLANLLAELDVGRSIFELTIDDYPDIDWTSSSSWIVGKEAMLKIAPIGVKVKLTVRGEQLLEHMFIDGLFLHVVRERIPNDDDDDTRSTIVTLQIVTSASGKGVQIYRE